MRRQYALVAGAHRLAAAKKLGWSEIPCLTLYDEPDEQARLWEIAENLHRAELTALERSELISEWIGLTDKVGQLAPPLGGIQPNDKGVRRAVRELGIERTEARRSDKIAGLSPEAKAAAREVGLDDNQSALLTAAHVD
ncbi:conserved hypothetical protein [Methylocella tundrae]|uniref:ParB-like N-terminal domain-containing protein n=1 Tax=Methylocella tundrae TaxID=227605 RepID=A0A8B6MBT2_METTU|nr:conserved hypothetical protein [Methylocella tundrae]VTZ52181.1 conserved hypothetical protein [Methylocella tundrae]